MAKLGSALFLHQVFDQLLADHVILMAAPALFDGATVFASSSSSCIAACWLSCVTMRCASA